MRLLGAILAGGQSRRFGSDKALALLDGKPLIEHVAAALGAQVDALIVCGREWGSLAWVPDRPAADMGPLGGINAAIRHAANHGFDAVVTSGCDLPGLPADLATRLGMRGDPAYVGSLPVLGFWPAGLADALDRHLASARDRSVRGWARAAGAVAIELPDPIANINTPVDLAELGGGAGHSAGRGGTRYGARELR